MIDSLPEEFRALFNDYDQNDVLAAIAAIGKDAQDVRRLLAHVARKRRDVMLGLGDAN